MRALVLTLSATTAHAEAPNIVVDIAPLHALITRVTDGITEPTLLLPPGANAHDYALRPSDARALSEADVIIWMGDELTPWLADPIETLAPNATVITLLETGSWKQLPWREPIEIDETHDEHDEHDDEDNAHSHDLDPHAWLHPGNMYAWLNPITDALVQTDPDNAASYTAATGLVQNDLAKLHGRIQSQLYPLRASGTQFAVAHDAIQYFEDAMGLSPAINLGLSQEQTTGPAHLAELRAHIDELGIDCILLDPFSDSDSIAILIEGTGIPTARIDPEGRDLTPGPNVYHDILQGIADAMTGCTPE